MKTQLEKALLAARETGTAQTELSPEGSKIKVRIASASEAITVRFEASAQDLCEDAILSIVGILGHPPDAVYHIPEHQPGAETLEAVWAHPEKSFEEELRSVVPRILAPQHRILMVSDRLYHYLVPAHPAEWDQAQVRTWNDFWNLRLRDASFREWILQYTDAKVWDYFRVIAKSVNQDIMQKQAPLGDLPLPLQERLENLFLSAALTGFHLFYLHCRRNNLSLASTVGNVDPEQMMQRVLSRLSWENVPKGFAAVVNEINITDIRESGELFAQAVTMPPDVLNEILSQANKCSVLGYLTGEAVREITDLN